jgi:mannose-1-phosphate guanylyltransferase
VRPTLYGEFMNRSHTWALVLAGGDGVRLASLTTNQDGQAVPKQFCSLNGGESLLQASLRRARQIVPRRRVCAIVTRSHECYWRATLRPLTDGTVIVQPRNRGTAHGLLLGVLRILERDPLAHILLLPAGHHVLNERSLINSMRTATALVRRDTQGTLKRRLLLVGITPEAPDPGLGYIVQGAPLGAGTRYVTQFIDKPPVAEARALIAHGALWSCSILAAHGVAIVASIREHYPDIVDDMAEALKLDATHGASALEDLYEHLPELDFSQAVAQAADYSALCVYAAPRCGWNDLGTPRRVGTALHRLWISRWHRRLTGIGYAPAFVNLGARYHRLDQESAGR